MTDAEFLRFLRHGGSQIAAIIEIDFAYESGGTKAIGQISLADSAEAVSGSTPYRDASQAPLIERAIDLARLGGRGSRTVGEFIVNNADGAFDYLLDVIIDGYDATIALGGEGWARSDYRAVARGAVASVRAPNDGEMVVSLRDKNYLLDDTIIGSPIASGPNEGKPRPILAGFILNFDITPYLFDESSLVYYLNDFALDGGTALQPDIDVRDLGVSLHDGIIFTFSSATLTANAGTDTLTKVGHTLAINDVIVFRPPGGGSMSNGLTADTQYWVLAAGFTADDFRVSLTKGGAAIDITGAAILSGGTWGMDRRRFYIDAAAATIELSADPEGRVTVDFIARDAAGDISAVARLAEVQQFILENYTRLEASEIDTAAIASLVAANARGCGLSILDRKNVLEVLDVLAFSGSSWYAWDGDGVMTFGELDLPNLDAATPVNEITDEADIIGDLSAENLPLPWGRMVLDTHPNVVTQTDGVSADPAVTPEQRSAWASQFRVRVTTTDPATSGYLANWWDYHKSAIDSPPQSTVLSSTSAVPPGTSQGDVDDMTELFRPWTRVHRCTVGLDKYALNPGDCVRLTYPRYGLDSGKNCRVASVRTNLATRSVDLVLVRQALPDYTTAVH